MCLQARQRPSGIRSCHLHHPARPAAAQGSRRLPLLKLSLHENLALRRAAEEAEAVAAAAEREAAAAATAASAAAQRAAAAPPPAPASEAGSVKSTAGTAPAPARAAPLSPATPAAADGGLREPPQQAPQAQQAGFSLDDLLGLSWEPAAEPSQASWQDTYAALGCVHAPKGRCWHRCAR